MGSEMVAVLTERGLDQQKGDSDGDVVIENGLGKQMDSEQS